MTLLLLGAVVALCLLPSALFLGFWHVLVRLQHQSLVARTSSRAGYTDPGVTWGDVFDAYADPQQRLLTPPSASQPSTITGHQCPACATPNDRFASFCQNCVQKLD